MRKIPSGTVIPDMKSEAVGHGTLAIADDSSDSIQFPVHTLGLQSELHQVADPGAASHSHSLLERGSEITSVFPQPNPRVLEFKRRFIASSNSQL